ncbi:hypothetical protein HJC23_012965 [Cyclotella cryptica]|uniref:Uncharacterized protein n=1 Tax=Cyclotella cryptica TaxID=29204 RepID=A0ABD3QFZ0_9STRA
MVRRPLTLLLLHQTLLLPPTTVAQDLIRVCGSDYGDASYNCTVNPPCETGDGCPADKDICFALPETECRSPPTSSPTELPLKVCGFDYDGALSNCTGQPCDDMGGCPTMMACFSVFPSDCLNASMSATMTDDLVAMDVAADANATADAASNSTGLLLCAPSFEEAAANCTGNTVCTPGGMECATGQACFTVPLDSCVGETNATATETNATMTETNATETNATMTDVLLVSPSSASNETMELPATSPTAPPVQPDFLFVCGANYTDADMNMCVNPACPTGDGCDVGLTCFAVPFVNCEAEEEGGATTTVAATVAGGGSTAAAVGGTTVSSMNETVTTVSSGNETVTTVSSGSGTTTVVASATNASIVEVNTTAPTAVGGSPTAAPMPNLFFCGESYELAVMNCFTNQPCATTAAEECPSGQACFGIPSQCLPPLPTASPSESATTLVSTETTVALASNETNSTEPAVTSAEPSLAPISVSPTASPIVNERFCGDNYTDAQVSCDFDTACPGGFECPSGQTCFTGIICPATAAPPVPPTASPSITKTTSGPTLRGTATSSTTVSMIGTSAGSTVTSSNGTAEVFRFCGFTPEDAADNCAINTPCPDGTAVACFSGQTCFELSSPCNAPSPVATPAASMAPVTDKPVFDPNITSYCGVDYPDAQDNCYKATPCPGNSNAECPNGQTCFPGIVGCEMPMVMTVAPTATPEEVMNETNMTVLPGAIVPTNAPSKKPSYDYEFRDLETIVWIEVIPSRWG